MQRPNQLQSQVNLVELKAQLVKRLGPDRSKLYFYYLNKLLSLKLSKAEFNKLCLRVIGRENIKLHNQLICSILNNACNAKVPPSASTRDGDGFEFSGDGYQKNEDVLLSSPWGTRARVSLGSDGKVDFSSSQQSSITGNNVVSENGDFDSHEIKKQAQHHQVISNKTNNEGEGGLRHPVKIKGPAESVISVDTNKQSETVILRDGKELSPRISVKAPLGIPLCPASVGGARQTPLLGSSGRDFSSYDRGELLDTETLKERMQQIATAHGIEGVSMDSANLLNNGLNAYLKRIIRSSFELVGARCGHDLVGKNTHKRLSHGRLANGVLPANQFHVQSSNMPSEEMSGQIHSLPLSLLDFKVAMWLKPQQLGDWPLLLEKICTHLHEE
ncbi:Transcriptional coactivator Hfi1/Transcriptional adapter 1 [Melia azedarach]|uniref:Transcriptional coactivator Hfi1/Transcriptional adapter 1 n=1 Tax=Melia azedarach TaxID=155640 RepID=A0ACC1Y6F4_MELAZ|nr:Transcriptional coactivator Hfi1/Transcriptional adapter 1 [Melia azedarach]